MAIGRTRAPEDCHTVAYAELTAVEAKMRQLLRPELKLDVYTRAHLQETADRIQKIREAKLSLSTP